MQLHPHLCSMMAALFLTVAPAYGHVNFCERFFDRAAEGRWNRNAQTVVHELFHHLSIPKSGKLVRDTHTLWKGCGRPSSDKVYGNVARRVANDGGCNRRNYRIPVKAADNYALFSGELGGRIYRGALTQFPNVGFSF